MMACIRVFQESSAFNLESRRTSSTTLQFTATTVNFRYGVLLSANHGATSSFSCAASFFPSGSSCHERATHVASWSNCQSSHIDIHSGRPLLPVQKSRQHNANTPMEQQADVFSNVRARPSFTQASSVARFLSEYPTASGYNVQQAYQMQSGSPVVHAAQLQVNTRMQQRLASQRNSSMVQIHPSVSHVSAAPYTQGTIPNYMPITTNMPAFPPPGLGQLTMAQPARSFPPQMYWNGDPRWLSPAFSMPPNFDGTAITGPFNRRVSAEAIPPTSFQDQFISNNTASFPQVPDPARTALHHALAKTPHLEFRDPLDPDKKCKGFRYIEEVFYYEALSNHTKNLQWTEDISEDTFKRFPTEIQGPIGLPFRPVSCGTLLARIRCVKLKSSNALLDDSCWATSDLCWPNVVAISVNEKFIDIRRRSHFGKDLASDVTKMLRKGHNDINASILGLPEDCTDEWLVGLERIAVVDTARIKEMLTFESATSCRDRILTKSRSTNPDVEVVQSQTVLDLTDPFTSRIFDMPVRGKNCTHNQCFDLDTFLETRGTALKPEPCSPDEFRCPICKSDVRPQMMVVDGYLVSLRSELAQRGRLDAKAVIVQENGAWEIKEENKDQKERRDGPASRPDSRPGLSSNMGNSLALSLQTSETKRKGKPQIETIVLDDD